MPWTIPSTKIPKKKPSNSPVPSTRDRVTSPDYVFNSFIPFHVLSVEIYLRIISARRPFFPLANLSHSPMVFARCAKSSSLSTETYLYGIILDLYIRPNGTWDRKAMQPVINLQSNRSACSCKNCRGAPSWGPKAPPDCWWRSLLPDASQQGAADGRGG